MPPLPIHILWPSSIQSLAVAFGRGPQIADVAAAFGLGDRQRRELEVTRGAEALRRPLQHLLGGGGLADRRQRQRRHHDRQTDSGATPEQLFHEHRQRKPGRVADEIAIEQRTVEAALGGLFEHRPGELLLLVVVQGHRPDDRFGELVGSPGQVVLCRGRRQVERHERSPGSVDLLLPAADGFNPLLRRRRIRPPNAAPPGESGR